MIGFISNSGWLDKNFSDGMRECIASEFNTVYVINLKGDIRKNLLTKNAAGEGENIFGANNMTGVAIVILCKNLKSKNQKIHYFECKMNLSKKEKLNTLRQYKGISKISEDGLFITVHPDQKNNWINQGDAIFDEFLALSDKKDKEKIKIIETHSIGVLSNRDHWVYNFSKKKISNKILEAKHFLNEQSQRYKGGDFNKVKNMLPKDRQLFSWTDDVIRLITKGENFEFSESHVRSSLYRPFTKTLWYSDKRLNWSWHVMGKIFPTEDDENIVIAISGGRTGFSALASNTITNKDLMDKGQCYPNFVYEYERKDAGLFEDSSEIKRSAITTEGLRVFQEKYPSLTITQDHIFHYTYGLFHSEEYKARFSENLMKEYPRLCLVTNPVHFQKFVEAGSALMNLHIFFETAELYPVTIKEGDLRLTRIDDPVSYFRVEKMKFAKKGDRSSVIYNKDITIENIPLEAYDYVVNGKPALEWVMDRQCVKTDKASGILNDANDYANEIMNNPAYPLELFQRVITVCLETMKIIKSLPKLDI